MKVLDFIVCEDIRNEVGAKFSLMGVYADSMMVHFQNEEKWPFVTRLGFYVKLDPEGETSYPICKFQVARGGKIRSAVPLQIASQGDGKIFAMMLTVHPFSISGPGVLDFSLEFSGPDRASLTVQLPAFEVKTGQVGVPLDPSSAAAQAPSNSPPLPRAP